MMRHPAIESQLAHRAANWQLRLADWITRFAGSMLFVYLHILAFVLWMLFVEKTPWPTLTLVVSLEAIFLSTFVMIGQNRAAQIQQAKSDHDFTEQQALLGGIRHSVDLDSEMETRIVDMETKLAAVMAENTAITRGVDTIVREMKNETSLLDEIHRHVTSLAPSAGNFPPDAPTGKGRGTSKT